MYYVENSVQPDKFPNIIATLWWAVATLTTVGYGDVYPVTILGKILSGLIAILGIGLVALPSGIISSGFITEINNEKTKVCPHCGKEIN
jgi:voltage-gated potassium channel